MKNIIIIGILVISLLLLLVTSGNAYANTTNVIIHNTNGGGNQSNNQNISENYLPVPNINFTPLQVPSLPSFPGYNISISVPYVFTWNFTVPNFADLPQFFLSYAEYIFEWIGVEIVNGILYLFQALYLAFAYIEYWLLEAMVSISQTLGVFALPVIVSLVIAIGIVVRLLIGMLKDATIIGAME